MRATPGPEAFAQFWRDFRDHGTAPLASAKGARSADSELAAQHGDDLTTNRDVGGGIGA
jgi:hypothetical protein